MRAGLAFILLVAVACAPTVQQEAAGRCHLTQDCDLGQICNAAGFCQRVLGCQANSDCPMNQTCNADAGTCLCTDNQGCGASQFCNGAGRCQDIGACQVNADCPENEICDTINKNCISSTECGGNIQCPLGQICSASSSACVPGCQTSGDCPQLAVNDAGVTVFAPQGCVNGQCAAAGACTETIGCTFGQVCNSNDTCVSACSGNNPYCHACDPNNSDSNPPFGDMQDCGTDNNLCLDDPRNSANCNGTGGGCLYWCGIDCSSGQACPAGYECSQVVIVTPGQSTCTCGSNDCGSDTCQCDEGATSGYCPCTSDFDCNAPGVTCVDGSCVIGSNCFPVNGLYCNDPGPECP
jgi:hypothetical protein